VSNDNTVIKTIEVSVDTPVIRAVVESTPVIEVTAAQRGPAGPAGPSVPGPKGDTGDAGADGAPGADGLDSQFIGTFNDVADLLAAYPIPPDNYWAFVKDPDPSVLYIYRPDPSGWVAEPITLPQGPAGADGVTPDLSSYATQSYVTSQGYITNSALSGYALASDIPTNTNQLTNGAGFVTTSTNLSSFNNDLSIDANDLTGTTLNSGITSSSLTSVGTLLGVTSSGVVHITNTEDSTNADTGSLQVDGGAHITKNLIAEGTIYAGKDAYSEALTNPLMVASSPSGVSGGYSQVAILNNTAEASGDFQVMIDGYDVAVSDTGWADLGMAGSNFSDERYTITNPGDGYVFVSGLEGSTNGGNLVLGTDSSGTNNDIVFATGGFLTENEKMRISNTNGKLTLQSGLINSGSNIVLTADTKQLTLGTNGRLTLPISDYGVSSIESASGIWLSANGKQLQLSSNGAVDIPLVNGTTGLIRTSANLTLNANGKEWFFDNYGALTFPSGAGFVKGETGQLKTNDGTTLTLDFRDNFGRGFYTNNDGYTLRSNSTYNWLFGTDGVLNLPSTVGDIKRDGVSVLGGGGSYTLPTASTSTLGGVKVDGTTIVINDGVISSTVVGAVTLKGTWDASTNTPTLSSSLPSGVTTGWQYLVSVTGTRDIGSGTQTYTAGDIVMFDGVAWVDIPGAAGSVASFNNRTGAVSLTSGDVTTALGFTPYNSSNPNNYITSSALSSYATQSYVTSQGYITSSALSSYATQSYVTSQGYITSSDSITGNAATATKLASAVTINGVSFDGSGNITVTAAAGTLTGTTLNAGITGSSLTSVGTLTNLTVTNPISGSVTGASGSSPAGALTGSTLASGVTASSLTSVGTLTNLTVTNPIAGTVQNGVVTTGSYADPSWITSLAYSKLTGAPSEYSLPTASTSTLGGVKVDGTSVTINGSGVISASAAAGTLSGSTLASGVTASSLTSVGTLTSLTVGGTLTRSGNVSAAAWGSAGIGLKIPAATYTDTSSVTTLSQSYVHTVGIPTLSFTNTTTISQAATLFIAGDPIAGTNASLTPNYSFGLYNGGKTYLAGSVRIAGSILSGGGAAMMSFSNTQATFNADVSVGGQLYLPARPAFRVYGNGGQIASVTTLTSSNWTQDFQQGTALNASTGIFTAPYAGLYQVNLVVRAYTNSGVSAQVICKKTAITGGAVTTVIMVEWAANTTMNHTGGSSIVKLAVGDTLKVDVTLGSISFDANDNWSVAFIG
jgi:hypothetical protein